MSVRFLVYETGNLVPLTDLGIRKKSLFLFLSGNFHPLTGNFKLNAALLYEFVCFGVAIKWKEIVHQFQTGESLVQKRS